MLFGFGGHCKATTLGVVTCDETSSVLICPWQGLNFFVSDLGPTNCLMKSCSLTRAATTGGNLCATSVQQIVAAGNLCQSSSPSDESSDKSSGASSSKSDSSVRRASCRREARCFNRCVTDPPSPSRIWDGKSESTAWVTSTGSTTRTCDDPGASRPVLTGAGAIADAGPLKAPAFSCRGQDQEPALEPAQELALLS